MFRRFLIKNGKLVFAILLLIFELILFYTDMGVITFLKGRTQSSLLVSLLDVKSTTSKMPIERPIDNFTIFDENCKILRVDPFAADVMGLLKPPKFKKCTDQPDLFNICYDQRKRQYIVQVNKSLLGSLHSNISDYACSSHEIYRGQDHSLVGARSSSFFKRDWIVPRHVEAAVVECFDLSKRSRILQRDALTFVQYPTDRNEPNDAERSRTHPSVILLGIGSMSQMNFHRTMPLTAQFVRQRGWYEMLGYNKIAENSFANVFTLLTGRTPRQWRQFCNVLKPGCLDEITYLWNHFRNAGYLTAYAEDRPVFGFKRPPVDYYLHPIIVLFDKILGGLRRLKNDYCLGRRQSFHYVFDYCLQLVERFVHDTPKPLFGVFWTNSFSRDDFSAAANVDKDFVSFLQRCKELGLFEKAVVILFSDHGQRRGPLMKFPSGFLEERLPMLHIYLPPWYRRRYPEAVEALDVNRRRLSSTFDLHYTVKVLLLQLHPCMSFAALRNSQPLTQMLSANRSCHDAGISEYSCSCTPYVQMAKSDDMLVLGRLMVSQINRYLSRNNYNRQCYRLEFASLLKVERMVNYDAKGNEVNNVFSSYRMEITTRPMGMFYGKANWNRELSFIEFPEKSIGRSIAYHNDSYCVKESMAKKLCICNPAIENMAV